VVSKNFNGKHLSSWLKGQKGHGYYDSADSAQ